jgi:hypothetical protein
MRLLLALVVAATVSACDDQTSTGRKPALESACAGSADMTEALGKALPNDNPAARPRSAAELAEGSTSLLALRDRMFDACQGYGEGRLDDAASAEARRRNP